MIKLAALVILSLIFNFCGNDKQPEAKNKIASEEQNNEEKIQNLELNKIDDDYKTYEWDLKFPYTRQSIYLPPFFNDKEPKTDLYPVQTVYDDTPICNTDETACRAKCTKECLDQIKGLNYNLAKISDSELINKLVIKSKREGGCEKIKINYEKPFNLNNTLQRGRLFVSST